MKHYPTIVVDPPWSYGRGKNRGKSRNVNAKYRVLGRDGGGEIGRKSGAGIESIISATPIGGWARKDAHLYLWTTNPKLPFAFRVMEQWGFVYKTMITWVKTRADGGVIRNGQGFFFRGATEHVLFGVKGRLPIPPALREPNVVEAQRGEHSEKPEAFYQLVERVSPRPRLDVYARRIRDGWDVWGEEVGVTDL